MLRARIHKLPALLAALALVAAGLLPALHGAHALHAGAGASIAAAGAQVEAGDTQEAAPCPLCVGVAQARTALSTSAPALDPTLGPPSAAPVGAAADLPAPYGRSPAAPRAPPSPA